MPTSIERAVRRDPDVRRLRTGPGEDRGSRLPKGRALGEDARTTAFGEWRSRTLDPWTTTLVAGMLLFAPLFRGGNRPIPLMILELLAVLLLCAVFARRERLSSMPRSVAVALLGMCLLPLTQLVPVSFPLWAALPGRRDYAAALAELVGAPARLPLSVVPVATEGALLALLPPIAVFLAVSTSRPAEVRPLVWVFLAVAVFQAVVGLMQYGGGPDSALRFGHAFYVDSAIGTYANRSHLAGMLVMALPIALSLLASALLRLNAAASPKRHGWLAGVGTQTNLAALYGAMAIALLLGIVFARSRTGIAVGMMGLALSTLVLARNFGGRFSLRMLGAMTAAGATLAVIIGLAPVFARFALDTLEDGRWPILEATLVAARAFFPLGSGAGTYAEVMRAYHPREIGGETFINHAHNDYAEWLVEGGLAALLLVLAFAVLYVVRCYRVWSARSRDTLHMMRVGAGVGLLLLALFGFTDYNLRIPANQIYFALLAAVFFHPADLPRVGPSPPAGRGSRVRARAVGDARQARPKAGAARRPQPRPADEHEADANRGENPFA